MTIMWPKSSELEGLSDHQREQYELATHGLVAFLSGSPGCGKTYVAAAAIKAIQKTYPTAMLAAAGPTGKSAVRLTESLEKCGVALAATTVHSLLKVKSNGDDGFGFEHDQRNPLIPKFVLIDEASMLDVPLFAALLSARPMGGHYLILGDPNQLAPVGHGAPLRDLLRCPESAPAGTLSEIRRNSGRVVQVCADIRDRKPWQASKKLDLDNGENLILVNAESPADQIEMLSSIIRKFRDASPQKYNPIWDIQVICAVNKKGELARKKLNPLLQGLLNPDGYSLKDCPFRVGDKIVNLKNGLLKSADPLNDDCDQDGRVYVANGEQAEVIEVEPGVITARMTSPARTVLIYRKGKSDQQKAAEDAARGEEDENENGEASGEASNTGCSWDLGYAQSCHKCQGSEWPIVIIMLDGDNAASRTCSRQWIYTGFSRIKSFGFAIGTKKTADKMCGRDALFARKTFLKERVEELKLAADEAEWPLPAMPELPLADELPDAEPLVDEAVDEYDFSDILEGIL